MRAWMFGLSIVFHLFVVGGLALAPLFATGELPTPPRTTEYVLVSARLPEPPPVQPSARATRKSQDAAPLETRDRIEPESPTPEAPASDALDTSIGGSIGTAGPAFLAGAVPGNPLPPPPSPPRLVSPVRVGGAIRPPAQLVRVAPKYPPLAQAAHVQGIVILEAVIGTTGAVQDVHALRATHPLLEAAALEAVRQWRFSPTLLNGDPVPVVMTVTVSFTLP